MPPDLPEPVGNLMPPVGDEPGRRLPLPIERVAVSQTLDGAAGRNRGSHDRKQIAAINDLEAIRAWLNQYPEGGNTWRAYRKEAERFLGWATLVCKKPVSSLGPDDCARYRDFLTSKDMSPEWCGRPCPRWHPDWRPFIGPLSPRSAFHAVTVLRKMCSWLKDVDYLATNPWAAVNLKPLRSKAGPTLGSVDVGRALDRDLIERIWSLCDRWEEAGERTAALERQRFAFLFGYLTGTRLAELASMVAGDIRVHEGAGKPGAQAQLWIDIVGKGSKKRAIPLTDDAVGELQRYLDYRGLPTDPRQLPPSLPLLPALLATGKRAQAAPEFRPLSSSTLHRLLKQFFHRAANAIEDVDAIAAKRLRLASTHWLRHSHGSHADAAGVSLETIRRNLGHSSLQTTSAYIHAEDDRRWRETGKLGRSNRPGI